ncbi:hypothetical protein A2917_02210 [Candidatus Nomurabacteria bacterium RIFCSPLOWO2_01_FULL_42_17]|uniref:Uncharacterized protein n=1 Tax=Candidatus Nomurabacteria bacterium RIFCSPLOWO2_01_FULL_42_17 TaxID=1801780 RepID=A0A1F6XMF9_9BACT|nr:MAG: hypothetical protein A2917_02210 [Candidatus Nomurabacteria bacterium RIFCSPLOWO2_01_FULL_42_17]
MAKLKNIIIFVAIGAAFVLIYIFFIKPDPEPAGLVSSAVSSAGAPTPTSQSTPANGVDKAVTADFLNLLLSVKSIKLDDSIFADIAFTSLHDSSITLVQDGTEGRINPFAPLSN